MVKALFKITEISYLAPRKQIRFTPKTTYFLWIVFGSGRVLEFQTDEFPFEWPVSYRKNIKPKDYNVKGVQSPKSPFNPNKQIPAEAKLIESGEVNIINEAEGFISGNFKGKKIKGLHIIKKEATGDIWLMEKSSLPGQKMTKYSFLLEQKLKLINRKLSDDQSLNQEDNEDPQEENIEITVDDLIEELTGQLEEFKEEPMEFSIDSINCELSLQDEFSEGKEMELPLKISGIAITEGMHKAGVFYPAEELQEAADRLEGTIIYLDHNTGTVSNRVGKVTYSWYNPVLKGIEFDGWIEDEKIASKVYHGLIDSVSLGVRSRRIPTELGTTVARDLMFKEISLVGDPADIHAKIKVKGDKYDGREIRE